MELATLYTDLRDTLLSYISSKVPDRHDAEDILHNTFIKVASNLDSVSRPEKLQAWIFAVTRNGITDYHRAKAGSMQERYEEGAEHDTEDEAYNQVVHSLDCCLMKFLNELPEEYRDILIDVELKGVRQKDLVEKYGLAYPSVRSRVQRGRERLKQVLLGCCDISLDKRGNLLQVDGKGSCLTSPDQSCGN